MKQKKREFNLYSYYDFSGMARHLEDMARQGWQPVLDIPPLSAHGNAVRGGVF